jgi:hypothetical protein
MRQIVGMKVAKLVLLLAVMMALGSQHLMAGDWPQWRGPDANGISKESLQGVTVLEEAWKAELGLGFSGFVVAGGRYRLVPGCGDGENGVETFLSPSLG